VGNALARNQKERCVVALLRALRETKNISDFKGQVLFLLPAPKKAVDGAVAQLVEQRTENPCVGGSIPPHTTL